MDSDARAQVVAAFLRDGNRVLLCHRSATRRWCPDVWDLPGGHIDPGERAGAALVREVREELGIAVAEPSGPPSHHVSGATYDMRVWLVDSWAGTPVNAAPDEHDDIAWFDATELSGLRLAHDSYLTTFTSVLTGPPW
ncbi:NUDIX domain-containing protein [Dactylosporangium siamense]|uniref:8-oxo-dGTP diphosphatase n=1 Tax=Dactylosporangium siamense TaxID=685454 RepID=A0A919UCS1_9ACTN|nr:NUDIX hydrolase [Dactylosporangium siamense]GIG47111.1 hypothetical protein Dsi01nite_051520 [Dactylosporangium siamense]